MHIDFNVRSRQCYFNKIDFVSLEKTKVSYELFSKVGFIYMIIGDTSSVINFWSNMNQNITKIRFMSFFSKTLTYP